MHLHVSMCQSLTSLRGSVPSTVPYVHLGSDGACVLPVSLDESIINQRGLSTENDRTRFKKRLDSFRFGRSSAFIENQEEKFCEASSRQGDGVLLVGVRWSINSLLQISGHL